MNLPHRFSEKSFRRYEPIITAIVREFPKATVVQPSDLRLSAETVRGRLKDAISSLHIHRWKTNIDLARLDAFVNDIVVSLRPDGTVIAGDKLSVKGEVFTPIVAIDPNNILDCTEGYDLQTLVLLAHNKALSHRLKVNLSPAAVTDLESSYDIILTPYDNDSYLLT